MRVVEVVLAVEQVIDLGVEDLPGQVLRLFHDGAAELGVGVVAEVLALVDEALPVRVHHDAQEVADLAVVLALEMRQIEVAEVRRVEVHRRGVAAAEEAVRAGPELQRHLQALPLVVRGAAHLGLVPTLTDVAAAQGGIGLEAAAGEDDRAGAKLSFPAGRVAGAHAPHRAVLDNKVGGRALEADLAADVTERLVLGLDEAIALVAGGERQATPEHEASLLLEGLARIDGLELDPVRGEPANGRVALVDQGALLPRQGTAVVEAE